MGNSGSSLVDCVQDCDTHGLKQQLAARVAELNDGELSDAELHTELEDAVHTTLSMEVTTPQQYQQLQIALELLLQLAPTTLQTSECNNVQWTALHRACVTSNLAFVAFLFHRYAPYLSMDRDAFGLLPLDLVPPEISFIGVEPRRPGPTDIKALPSTERERVELALEVLRSRKTQVQQRAVRSYVTSHTNQDTTDENPDDRELFFVAFEPSRGQLGHEVVGVVHQIDFPLRVRYHLPRIEPFIHGYFQLIWRADDYPRSEEPNYEHHVLLRENVDLDSAAPRSEDLASNQCEPRRLHDKDPESSTHATLTGSVALDVAHLPDDVVCHVLFVASDRQLMHRQIVLSTEGVRLVRPDLFNVAEVYEEPPYEYDVDSDGDDLDGFVFHVGGEAFKHPSEALAGRSFETVEEFEAFVKDLRVSKATTSITKTSREDVKNDAVLRPSVLSNQEEEEDEDVVVVDASTNPNEPDHDNQHECME